jgi:FkbM family methyltransferase
MDPLGFLLQRLGSFRGRHRVESVWARTTGKGVRSRRLQGGGIILCDLAVPYDRNVWLRREEERDLEKLASLLKPDSVFVDCGANIGLWTLTAAPIAKRVVALEPTPDTAERLRSNIAVSGFSNTVVIEAAVGAAPGRGFLEESHHHNVNRLVSDGGREVDVVTLDSIGDVDGIKIDVEGAEVSVLQGAVSSLTCCRPWVMIEFNSEHIGSVRLDDWEAHRLLRDLGHATTDSPSPRLGWYSNLLYLPTD